MRLHRPDQVGPMLNLVRLPLTSALSALLLIGADAAIEARSQGGRIAVCRKWTTRADVTMIILLTVASGLRSFSGGRNVAIRFIDGGWHASQDLLMADGTPPTTNQLIVVKAKAV